MSAVTYKLADYVSDKGVNLSRLSRETEIPYPQLYASLSDKKKDRDLRDWELVKICKFLGVNPMDFAE